jgi:hypothetical protein
MVVSEYHGDKKEKKGQAAYRHKSVLVAVPKHVERLRLCWGVRAWVADSHTFEEDFRGVAQKFVSQRGNVP